MKSEHTKNQFERKIKSYQQKVVRKWIFRADNPSAIYNYCSTIIWTKFFFLNFNNVTSVSFYKAPQKKPFSIPFWIVSEDNVFQKEECSEKNEHQSREVRSPFIHFATTIYDTKFGTFANNQNYNCEANYKKGIRHFTLISKALNEHHGNECGLHYPKVSNFIKRLTKNSHEKVLRSRAIALDISLKC